MRPALLVVAALAISCGPAATAPASGGHARTDGTGLPLATPCAIANGIVTISLAANEQAALTLDGSSRLTVNGALCSTASASTITHINISSADLVAATDEGVVIDGTNGFFAPGSAAAVGIVISLGAGTGDSVEVVAATAGSVLVTGRSATDDWAIFNHDAYRDITMNGVDTIALTGGAGDDVLSGSSRAPGWTTGSYYSSGLASQHPLTLSGNAGNDVLVGGDGADQLLGGAGNDTLAGGAGNDTENGGPGNDTFDQGSAANGADVLIGGTETDTVTYTARTNAVTVTVGSMANDGEPGEGDDVRSDIEVVVGGAGDDTLSCSSSVGCTLHGGPGNDTLIGRNGNDDLEGEAGDDLLQPGPGDDVVNGGSGTDTVTYTDAASGVTVVLGTPGTPTTGNGTSGENDTLDTVENIVGSPFGDTLTGNALDNRLTGGAGNDVLNGGAGNDTFDEGTASNGHDTINGGSGEDRVDYSGRSNALVVVMDGVTGSGETGEGDLIGADVEDCSGGSGADSITGNALDNKLDGNDGDDTLIGLAGNDELTGGRGFDTLDGGAGDDILDQGADSASCVCGPGFDIAICDTAPLDCEVR